MTTTTSARDQANRAVSPASRELHRHGKRSKTHRRLRVVLYLLAGATLVTSTVVAVMFRHDMEEARARLAAQPTEIFQSSYGDIEYRVAGAGPTVLVSHGITGGVDQAEALVTQWRNFQPDQYRFIYVSRFGYLGSDLPDGATARTQAAAYRELLDHLGVDRTFVVGNSAGGPSAMWFAIDYPNRTDGLILISSAVPGPEPDYIPELVAKHDFIYWAAVKAAPDKLLGLMLPESVIAKLSEEQKDFAVRNAFIASMPISERTDGIMFDSKVTLPNLNQLPFEQIKPPTLIVQSTDDPREAAGGKEMARRIPNSTLIGFTGGHLLLGHETEIQQANAEFIARHVSPNFGRQPAG
jgi:pimeloyl-ACP methyl ester carboxylesterase